MVIAPCEQDCASRGAESRSVEARIAETHLRQAVEIWRGNLSPERAPLSETCVIDIRMIRTLGAPAGPFVRVIVPGVESLYVRPIFAP
jgi:hypothetical protein